MEKILKIFISLSIILTIIAYSNISTAATLNELQNEKSSVNNKIDEAEEELEGIVNKKSETLDQVKSLISQISSYQGEIDDLQSQINGLKVQIFSLEKQIQADEKEYQEKRDLLDTRIVATYKNGSTTYLDFLLSSSNLMDFISSYYLISQVVEYDQKLLDEVNAHKEKIEKEKESIESSKKELESKETTLLSKQQALKVAKKEKEAYVAQLSDDEKETEQKIQELQDANDKLDKEIKAAKAKIEAAKASASSSSSNKKNNNTSYSSYTTASSNTTKSSYGFIWPTLARYSITTQWYYSTGALHGASDFSGAGIYGTPIYAVADGYVIKSEAQVNSRGNYIGYGNYVMIAHYNGYYTLSAHMSSRVVSSGQTVSQGQVIGYVGSTGNSTGPHLHFEIRTGNGTYSERVNPIYYLPTNR